MYNQKKKKYQSPNTTVVAILATTSILAGSGPYKGAVIKDTSSQTNSPDKLGFGDASEKDELELESKGNGWDDTNSWDEWD